MHTTTGVWLLLFGCSKCAPAPLLPHWPRHPRGALSAPHRRPRTRTHVLRKGDVYECKRARCVSRHPAKCVWQDSGHDAPAPHPCSLARWVWCALVVVVTAPSTTSEHCRQRVGRETERKGRRGANARLSWHTTKCTTSPAGSKVHRGERLTLRVTPAVHSRRGPPSTMPHSQPPRVRPCLVHAQRSLLPVDDRAKYNDKLCYPRRARVRTKKSSLDPRDHGVVIATLEPPWRRWWSPLRALAAQRGQCCWCRCCWAVAACGRPARRGRRPAFPG